MISCGTLSGNPFSRIGDVAIITKFTVPDIILVQTA